MQMSHNQTMAPNTQYVAPAHLYAPRTDKANKIQAMLEEQLGDELAHSACLDIGCATGAISNLLAPKFQRLVGVEMDGRLVQLAAANAAPNAVFLRSDGGKLPFPDAAFDLILCTQVYEHTDNQHELAAEIWRTLKVGGVCFFSGPNKLIVMEEHYWLPFLSWLPQSWADVYMQLTRRGAYYDVLPLTYWQLRKLWARFEIVDYTTKMVTAPERYSVTQHLGVLRWLHHLPTPFWRAALPLLPNYSWMLIKHG